MVFLDLRGFTAFTETAEPGRGDGRAARIPRRDGPADPRARGHARALHRRRHHGVLQRSGADRPMPRARAVRMALRDAATRWRRLAARLAATRLRARAWASASRMGFATIGAIGFEGRIDYGAIGTVTNLAARLCAEAAGGEVAGVRNGWSPRTGPGFVTEPRGEIQLKGVPAADGGAARARRVERLRPPRRSGRDAVAGLRHHSLSMDDAAAPNHEPASPSALPVELLDALAALGHTRGYAKGTIVRHRGRTGAVDVPDPRGAVARLRVRRRRARGRAQHPWDRANTSAS